MKRRIAAMMVVGLALPGCTQDDDARGEADTIRVTAGMIIDGDTVRTWPAPIGWSGFSLSA